MDTSGEGVVVIVILESLDLSGGDPLVGERNLGVVVVLESVLGHEEASISNSVHHFLCLPFFI